jgi:flagellar motility protein MotE (MotC chaperone)
MDPVSLAAAMAGAQADQTQSSLATILARMNANAAASVLQVIDSAQQNLQSLANVGAGIGRNVNISA